MSPAELYEEDFYEEDFYEWTVRNAELLRSGRVSEADLEHIAEEIEDMGKRERRELLSRLSMLMSHLLKWTIQPERRSRSWELTIKLQRKDLRKLLDQNPSLNPSLAEGLEDAYEHALVEASTEAFRPIDDFPPTCPFTLEVLLDQEYLP
jgi:hypothetical protein